MLDRLLSHDLPRSRWLAAVLIIVVLALAFAPLVFPGAKGSSGWSAYFHMARLNGAALMRILDQVQNIGLEPLA